ncbi:fumarylacetoacetate hydrolase family protein [Shewanella glacialipiscicola]|uniref:2-keto-4-pentenoate hydratase n=1 Tax=Shewanella glacialipiscicola TaxID=614069 RepID=A0ABQ6J5N3_9GAMM|nr:fumarylacetoacetate hydrolase family protein [Shewanella glacialipiscicola]MCL1084921.1 fumarylacetoacetate hydrolase family protein [Shewanella glacialipiscicola]MCU7996168.1 fumarylacetoacetate hydrolase family protein [Shewanella glacialipiscicola]MCU8027482.1 fumarylacetoacetate hydrolase family protein [Shewanella glacialipiscicola]GIU14189.1 2-keto-4-pentenoate hydratase [Shewanella glacialipiscicola]GMA82788.1 2-keto-4-pentenoate hydratase [Shewanella glacialipiscicola]
MKSVVLGENAVVPTKIICIGRNYVDHIHELGNEITDDMVVFLKPNSAISTVLLAKHQGETLHYETELCFMFQQGRFSSIAVGLDLTKRDLQTQLKAKGLPWERAKAFDGAALFSPFVAIDDVEAALYFSLSINDKQVQEGSIDLMIYKPQSIMSELQTFMSLDEGDIVMTGTPKGVGIIPTNSVFHVKLYRGLQLSAEPLLEWQWLSV